MPPQEGTHRRSLTAALSHPPVTRLRALGVIACALLLLACSTAHGRTQTRRFEVGFLGFGNPVASQHIITAMQQELGARGYVEGQNIHFEWRWGEGDSSRLPALAAELVALKPDVLFAGSDPPAAALQQATHTIPIAFLLCGDPVREGFVASLAHPGGNMTGYTESCSGSQLDEKRIEILKQIAPAASRLAVLWYPATDDVQLELDGIVETARRLGLQAKFYKVNVPDDLPAAFDAMSQDGAELLHIVSSSFGITNRAQIASLALQYHLPSSYAFSQYADSGGLVTYASNLIDDYRHAWEYVDRIHKGAKPADLPVEQPTTFDLVINLKTAQALGITIPDALLVQAAEVIR